MAAAMAMIPPEVLKAIRANEAAAAADLRRSAEAADLLQTAYAAWCAGDHAIADAAFAEALAMPPVFEGTADCVGSAAADLVRQEVDRQSRAAWNESIGLPSLDVVVDRVIAVVRRFAGEDDRDLRAALVFFAGSRMSDEASARMAALTDSVRTREALDGVTGDDARKEAVLRLLRAHELLRAGARNGPLFRE